jgi:hypothetical protein
MARLSRLSRTSRLRRMMKAWVRNTQIEKEKNEKVDFHFDAYRGRAARTEQRKCARDAAEAKHRGSRGTKPDFAKSNQGAA